jgi:hypothetical protein
MNPENKIDLTGYISSSEQKEYYRKLQVEEKRREDVEEFTNFEIDLYNMGRFNQRVSAVGPSGKCTWGTVITIVRPSQSKTSSCPRSMLIISSRKC